MKSRATAKTKRSRSTSRRPCVLVVDDDEHEGSAAVSLLEPILQAFYRSPGEVADKDIEAANVILVDFKLDRWPALDDATTPSLRPRHGIALAANLRSNLRDSKMRTPTAFALRSGKLHELSGKLSPRNREYALAKMLDFEWVFDKSDTVRLQQEVFALGKAVQSLPHPWPSYQKSEAALLKLLNLNARRRAEWTTNAIDEVRTSNPPQDVAAETTGGMAILRWLLHEVLPFPTFLLDERYLAARMRVPPGALRGLLNSARPTKIRKALSQFKYTGVLDDFLGPRWWRAGIDNWLWHETRGDPLNPDALRSLARRMLPPSIKGLQLDCPVVSVDEQYQPSDKFIELTAAVQIKPDDWPDIAEPAWVSMEAARENADLAARVIAVDRARIQATEK